MVSLSDAISVTPKLKPSDNMLLNLLVCSRDMISAKVKSRSKHRKSDFRCFERLFTSVCYTYVTTSVWTQAYSLCNTQHHYTQYIVQTGLLSFSGDNTGEMLRQDEDKYQQRTSIQTTDIQWDDVLALQDVGKIDSPHNWIAEGWCYITIVNISCWALNPAENHTLHTEHSSKQQLCM